MIRLGSLAGYPFEGPRLLGGWTPPAAAAVYAILYKPEPDTKPERYAVIYVSHADDLTAEHFPFQHPAASCWVRRAGSRWKVYICTYEVPGGTRVYDHVDTSVPAAALRSTFVYRHRQLADDLATHRTAADAGATPTVIAVTGASGLVGSALSAFLSTGGHRVIRLVRRQPRNELERQWNPDRPARDLLSGVDAVVHLAGAQARRGGRGRRRWSASVRQRFGDRLLRLRPRRCAAV